MPSSPGLIPVFAKELATDDVLALWLVGPTVFLHELTPTDVGPFIVYAKVVSVDPIAGNDSDLAVTLRHYSTIDGARDTETHHFGRLDPCLVLVGNPERLL